MRRATRDEIERGNGTVAPSLPITSATTVESFTLDQSENSNVGTQVIVLVDLDASDDDEPGPRRHRQTDESNQSELVPEPVAVEQPVIENADIARAVAPSMPEVATNVDRREYHLLSWPTGSQTEGLEDILNFPSVRWDKLFELVDGKDYGEKQMVGLIREGHQIKAGDRTLDRSNCCIVNINHVLAETALTMNSASTAAPNVMTVK